MAARSHIVEEMLTEFGVMSDAVRQRIDSAIGDITIDILCQNNSRFRKLSKTDTITIGTTTNAYKLPVDFKTAKKQCMFVDSDGDFIKKLEIVTEAEFYNRKSNPDYTGNWYAYTETRQIDSPGEYLVLNATPIETGYIKVFYYRHPNANDTDLIDNPSLIKAGVRTMFPEYVQEHQSSFFIYENMKQNVLENPSQRSTNMSIKPTKRQQNRNRLNYRIGKGL